MSAFLLGENEMGRKGVFEAPQGCSATHPVGKDKITHPVGRAPNVREKVHYNACLGRNFAKSAL
jgi:hypothetical protein